MMKGKTMISTIKLTSHACERLKMLQKKFIRVRIQAGGCAGSRFIFDFPTTSTADEEIIQDTSANLGIIIEKKYAQYLSTAIVDYHQEFIAEYFHIRWSEDAKKIPKCRCGDSFNMGNTRKTMAPDAKKC